MNTNKLSRAQVVNLLDDILLQSLTYYHYDHSLVPDFVFDQSLKIIEPYLGDTDIPNLGLIKEGHVRAGSTFDIPFESYPKYIHDAAQKLI